MEIKTNAKPRLNRQFRVSNTSGWKCQEHSWQEWWSHKMRKIKACQGLRNAERDYCESQKPERKNSKIPSNVHLSGLCESSDHFRDFVIMNFIMLESQWLEGKNVEIPSAIRLRKEGIGIWSFVDRWSGSSSGFVTWSVETLHHRNVETPKCETPKYL